MKTVYMHDAEKAEERLRKLETNQIHKSNEKDAKYYECGVRHEYAVEIITEVEFCAQG